MRLRLTGVSVFAGKVMSCHNLAHVIAYEEQKYRRESGWVVEEDEWPGPLPESFKTVFWEMVWNRTHQDEDLPPCRLGHTVLADLIAVFR